MALRTLVVSATNLLARGFLTVPTDRTAPDGAPVNALFAVARSLARALGGKAPGRAVAVVEAEPVVDAWPDLLRAQLEPLPDLLRALGLQVVHARGEEHLVASIARAAIAEGDDVTVVGVDKRYAQLVADRVWFYEANKDVRYTPEIVEKRFGVPPAGLADWLALVGDDSGNEVLPGVKGIGAKGATTLLAEHGSVETALAKIDALEGRLAKALRAAGEGLPKELARARLDATRAVPELAAYRPPEASALNTTYERLGFAELLVAGASSFAATVVSEAGALGPALARLAAGTLAIHGLTEDPAPVREAIAGIAIGDADGAAVYVPAGSAAWPDLAAWLEDERVAKVGHFTVALDAELRRAGVRLRGVVGDVAYASHLTESSNWAPHDLPIIAKHVLGRALADDDAIRGVGKQRKDWAKLPVARVAAHAGELADASAAIWRKLGPGLEPRLLADYLAIGDVCVRMELTGILVDGGELDRAESSFADIERELGGQIDALAGHSFNIGSSKQLGQVLFEELGLPVVSHTKTGFSTATEALERIEHAHPVVPLVLRWRALRRLRDNWLISLRRCIDVDGRVHSRFHPARSFSGQIVNSNPDLGRVPGRTPEMARIRRAFVAAPGRQLMSVDFNQLGLHVLAHLTKDPALANPLRERADMHRLTAAAVLEIAPDEVTTEQRQLGKVVNFATFAGQGASALALSLGITAQEAKAYIARFDRHYAKVRAFQDEQLRLAHEEGGIVTIAGRRWPVGGLESLDSQPRSYAERLARRATHEASVQDVSRRALLEADRAIAREGVDALPVLQILDEVLFDVAEVDLARAARVCADAMRHAYELDPPLVVGVEAGPNWADLEPLPV